MDYLSIMLILLVALGVVLFVYGWAQGQGTPDSKGSASGVQLTNLMEEITDISDVILDEMDGKYQELLFLYELMEEKKKNVSPEDIDIWQERIEAASPRVTKEVTSHMNIIIDDEKKSVFKHPLLEDILKLQESHWSLADIAKELDIGKGELQMIADLYSMTYPPGAIHFKTDREAKFRAKGPFKQAKAVENNKWSQALTEGIMERNSLRSTKSLEIANEENAGEATEKNQTTSKDATAENHNNRGKNYVSPENLSFWSAEMARETSGYQVTQKALLGMGDKEKPVGNLSNNLLNQGDKDKSVSLAKDTSPDKNTRRDNEGHTAM